MPNGENIGGIYATISIDLNDFQAQLDRAISLATDAGKAIGSGIASGTAQVDQLTQSVDSASGSFMALSRAGLALSGLSALIFEVGEKSLEAAGKFEQWQVSFTNLLGSEQLAKDKLEELVNFATRTPFEIPDVVSNAQRLMAFGFAAKDVIPISHQPG